MAGELFDIVYDKAAKYHYAAHDGTWAMEYIQDVSPYIKANKFQANEAVLNKHSKFAKDTEMGKHKARVPMVIWHKWMKEFQAWKGDKHPPRMTDPEFKKFTQAKLRDPDNRFLRVDGGRD